MKIRTDFVTNSSSSCFCLTYTFELKNGKMITYSATGNPEGWFDVFFESVYGEVSARELGMSSSIESMIKLVQKGTEVELDGFDFPRVHILEEGSIEAYLKMASEDLCDEDDFLLLKENVEAVAPLLRAGKEFVSELAQLNDVGEIKKIMVIGETYGHNGEHQLISTSYNMDTKEYQYEAEGDDEIYEEGSGGDLYISDREFAVSKFSGSFVRRTVENLKYLYDVVELAGTQYDGRNDRIEHVSVGDQLELVREPENIYDKNAIDVQNESGSLGHLPRDVVASLAALLDMGAVSCTATVYEVLPLSKRSSKAKKAILKVRLTYTLVEDAAESK